MKKVRIRISDGTKWERAIRKVAKNYIARMTARAVLLVNRLKIDAPTVSEIAEAIEYPTQQQVLSRWNRVKNRLNVKNPSVWTPSLIPNFDEYRQRIVDREDERWFTDILFGLKKEAYLETVAKAAIDLGREAWISPEAIEAIRAKTIKIVTTKITPTLRDQLVAKLEKTISAGFTIDETAHDLGILNTNWRTIAKTETFDVMNKGSFDQVKNEATEYGAEVVKFWQHSGNANGRESHIMASEIYNEENAIPIDEPFVVDGEDLMYPHDPSGSAENNINCGCTAVYIVKEP
jgi:hypothetical protein